jgi:hypothetical protein
VPTIEAASGEEGMIGVGERDAHAWTITSTDPMPVIEERDAGRGLRDGVKMTRRIEV